MYKKEKEEIFLAFYKSIDRMDWAIINNNSVSANKEKKLQEKLKDKFYNNNL